MVSAFDEIQAVLDEVSRDEQKTLLAFAKDRGYRVTSGFSHGGHNKGSKHYQGTEQDPMAIDIDHRGVNHQDLMAAAQAAGYRVLDERQRPAGQAVWGGPHYHLEKIAQAVAQQKPVVAQNAITQSNTFPTPAPQLVNRGPLLQQDEYGVLRRTGNYNTPQYTRSKVDTGSTIAQPKQPKKTVNYFSDIEQILADANQPKPPTPQDTSVGLGQGIANLGGAVAGGIGNLFSAATNPQTYVDLGNAAGKALQTEFSTPVNSPTERIEAVGLGALKGARDLAQGLINLPADIGNAYMGREVYTPGLGGVNFELPQVQSELLDKRPVSSFLGQSVPYMVPIGEAAAAVRGGKAVASGLGKSVTEGAVLDFISNPEGGGLEGRILNTGAGAALATGLGAGGGVLLRNADRMGRARDIGEVNLQSILGQEERAAAQQGLDQINRERQVADANEGAFLQPSDNDLNTVQQILDAREQENQLLNQRIRDLNEAYQARTRQPGGEVITQPFDETQAMRDLGMREGVTERVGDTDLVVAREGAKRPRPDIEIEIDRSPIEGDVVQPRQDLQTEQVINPITGEPYRRSNPNIRTSRDIALDRAQRMGQEPVRDLGDVTRLDQPTSQRPIDLAQPKPETRPLDLGQPQRSDTPLLDAQGRPLNRDLGATDSPSLVRDLAEITQPRQDIIQPPRDTGKATLPESGNVSRIGDAEVFTHGQDANVIKEQLQALQNNQEQLASIAAVEEHLKQVAPDASPYMRDIVQAGSEGQTVKFTYEPREAPGTIREREFAPGAFTLQKIKPNTERSFLRRQFNKDDQAIIQHLTQRINEAGGTVNAADLQTKAGSPRKTANQINTLIQKLDEVMGGRYLQSPRIHGLNVGADSTRGGLDVNRNRGIRLDSIRSTQLTGSAVTPEGIQNIGGASEYANQIKPAMSAIRELASAQGAPREFKRIANQLTSGNITSKTVADMRKLFAELPEQAQALCNILGMG